jgi:hypothetical protein
MVNGKSKKFDAIFEETPSKSSPKGKTSKKNSGNIV